MRREESSKPHSRQDAYMQTKLACSTSFANGAYPIGPPLPLPLSIHGWGVGIDISYSEGRPLASGASPGRPRAALLARGCIEAAPPGSSGWHRVHFSPQNHHMPVMQAGGRRR